MYIDLIQNLFHVLQQSSSDQFYKSLSLTLPLFQREDFMKIQSSWSIMLHQVVNSTDIYHLIWHHTPEKENLHQYCCVCPNSYTEEFSFVETYSCEQLV